jgi:hypothetical protein
MKRKNGLVIWEKLEYVPSIMGGYNSVRVYFVSLNDKVFCKKNQYSMILLKQPC